MAVLAALGDHDVGQGVVVQGGRVIAIEAAEGTDAMLDRVAGLLDAAAPAAVFVKAPKTGQDSRLDPPAAGAETLRRAAAAGIGIIALKADGVVLADEPESLRRLAEELRLAVVEFDRAGLHFAGEPSGDRLAASLMGAINDAYGQQRWIGVGGPAMAAQGLTTAHPMDRLTVMGFGAALVSYPRLSRFADRLVDEIIVARPRLVMTVDVKGFSSLPHD